MSTPIPIAQVGSKKKEALGDDKVLVSGTNLKAAALGGWDAAPPWSQRADLGLNTAEAIVWQARAFPRGPLERRYTLTRKLNRGDIQGNKRQKPNKQTDQTDPK